MSLEPAISVNHLSKVYDLGLSGRTDSLASIVKRRVRHPIRGSGAKRERFHALDDVSFDVAQGEVVGVIGNNGAGKSTLLKILSRITPPSAGYVEMAGSVGSLLEVGTGFHPELTGRENVYLNGTILGMSRRSIERRLEEILDFAEVGRFLETPVKRYSSGMRVRLAFAVAAHLEPEILIIDEVLSVGDFSFQAKCLDKMKMIASEHGRTVLYVSHNLVTVENLCPRAMLLVGGKVAFDGPSAETVSNYLHLFPRADRGEMPGVFDLAAADRSGSDYAPVLKRLEFSPGGTGPSDKVRPGERVRIEITVEGLDDVPDPFIGITVGTTSVAHLVRMTSRMVPLVKAHERRPRETVVVDIPALNLTPGEYFLEIQIKDQTKTVDFVRNAADFTVVAADYYGTGYQFVANDGYVLMPWEWELRPADTQLAGTDSAATRSH